MLSYTVIDLEMTGLSAKVDKIIEIGAVKVAEGKIIGTYSTLVNPKRPIPQQVRELTGITDDMVRQAKSEDEAVRELLTFWGEDILVGHNVGFDYSFLKQWAINHKEPLEVMACDTLKIARGVLPAEQKKTLEALCDYFSIERKQAHRALDDALETREVFERLIPLAEEAKIALLEPKALQYRAKRVTPATGHQVERLKEFIRRHQIPDEICFEALTRSEASRIMDRYYATYGRD